MRFARRVFFVAIACAAATIVVACSLYGEEEAKNDEPPPAPSNDSGAGDDVTVSADAVVSVDSAPSSDGGAACHGSFGEPILVAGLQSNESEYSARLTPDELTIYITRPDLNVVGLSQTWVATRTSTTSAFSGITKMGELGALSESIAFASVPANRLSIFFQVRAQADAAPNLFTATRAIVSVPFGPRTTVPFTHAGELAAPYVTPAGDALWINFNEPNGRKIVRLPLKSTDIDPREHLELGNDVGNPVVTGDELEIFFYRPIGIHRATRSSKNDGFGVPTIIRSGVIGLPSWISPDGCRLYVCIDADTNTKTDIFVLNRDP